MLGERRSRWLAADGVRGRAGVGGTGARGDYTIPGSPLTVYANDSGRQQVAFTGSATGEFYPGTLGPASAGVTSRSPESNARARRLRPPGLGLAQDPHDPARASPVTEPPAARTSSGSTSRPGRPPLRRPGGPHLRQRDQDVGVRFALEAFDNAGPGRALRGRGPLRRGQRSGVGVLDPGPPLQVGGVNAPPAAPHAWSGPRVDPLPGVVLRQRLLRDREQHDLSAPNLSDAVNPDLGDNDSECSGTSPTCSGALLAGCTQPTGASTTSLSRPQLRPRRR